LSPRPCCQTKTAMPLRPHSPRHRSNRLDEETTTQFAPKLFRSPGICWRWRKRSGEPELGESRTRLL
jgi:hypothetical protein